MKSRISVAIISVLCFSITSEALADCTADSTVAQTKQRYAKAQQLETAEARQHRIEHDHVMIVMHGQMLAVDAVVCHVHTAALFRQSLLQVVGSLALVFNDQDFHGCGTGSSFSRE